MNAQSMRWRMTAVATALSMTIGGVPGASAAPPPIAGAAGPPPGRVGRLGKLHGTVSFHTADQTAWSPATLNYPITTGNALWTEASADATVGISGNRIEMAGTTELDIATLDDHALVASEPQGALYLALRNVPNGDTYTLQTPRATVQIAAGGRYEVVAGDTDHPTTVTVVEGAAQVTGTNITLQVNTGQMASITGTDTYEGAVGPMQPDAFLTAMLAADRPAPRSTVPVPPVVARMTGGEELDQYGSWADTPQNGAVWYPQVETGWVPYRQGRWTYVAPWGWTWVDAAPWGFAPFHYGRWIDNGGRWGWVPAGPPVGGPVVAYQQPVYAPALVSFVDIGAAVAVGAAVGLAAGGLLGGGRGVGWVPLGPNEPYYPPYSNRVDYVRNLNSGNVRNVNQVITDNSVHNVVNNHVVVQNFINRGGATVVPATAMTGSTPIAGVAQPLAAQQLATARAQFQAPVTPAAATVGVTPAVARQFNIAAPTPAAGPGPSINPAAFRAAGPRAAFVPPLQRVNAPDTAATAQPAAPAPTPRPAPPGQAEPLRPGAGPSPAVEPARPGPAVAAPEAARPGVLPALRPAAPATPGQGEPARPGAPGPAIAPGRPGPEAGAPQGPQPGVTPALRPATPVAPAAPRAVRPAAQAVPPAGHGGPVAAARPNFERAAPPAPRPAPAAVPNVARPAVPVPQVVHPVAPVRPTPPAPPPRPEAVARPAPPPAPRPAPRPEPPAAHAAPPPAPRPPPPAHHEEHRPGQP